MTLGSQMTDKGQLCLPNTDKEICPKLDNLPSRETAISKKAEERACWWIKPQFPF